ncbi:hypothetical protein B0H13DRAFT_2108873 [Mycena leptocephala]|nr:hypothetical protein B0H13DRAFT_2127217 [Mycena leptocephala]KAJ7831901.1 hypothetical protein B0H13DRAFT_2113037 [Mycena leptocephala]KAJ7835065.1 hypothetical protein B0H13DRAFT_2108873 [Mycena leptocephala]
MTSEMLLYHSGHIIYWVILLLTTACDNPGQNSSSGLPGRHRRTPCILRAQLPRTTISRVLKNERGRSGTSKCCFSRPSTLEPNKVPLVGRVGPLTAGNFSFCPSR